MKRTWFAGLALVLVSLSGYSDDHKDGRPAATNHAALEAPGPCTAFSYVFGEKTPKTSEEVSARLQELGTTTETTVLYSQAPQATSLENPRHLVAFDGLKPQPGVNSPQLGGRLYFGFNLSCNRPKKTFDIKTTEFITWNFSTRRFDFGVIDGLGTAKAKAHIVPRAECMVCHKLGGPIFGVSPWSNTISSPIGFPQGSAYFSFLKELNPEFKAKDRVGLRSDDDFPLILGMKLHETRSESFDSAVRGSNLWLRSQKLPFYLGPKERANFAKLRLKAMMTDEAGRAPGEFRFNEKIEALYQSRLQELKKRVRAIEFPPDALELNNDELFDLGIDRKIETISTEPADNLAAVRKFEAKHLATLLPADDPSGPRKNNKVLQRDQRDLPFFHQGGEDAPIGATTVLDPADEIFLPVLAQQVVRILKLKKMPMTGENYVKVHEELLEDLLSTPQFEKFAVRGVFPERHEFFPTAFSALNTVMQKKHGFQDTIPNPLKADSRIADCETHVDAPNSGSEKAKSVQCMSCHGGGGKPVAPRLMLAFDPYDAAARAAWVKANKPEAVKKELARLKQWIFDDLAMPPLNAPGADSFRIDSPENKALRKFLDENLK